MFSTERSIHGELGGSVFTNGHGYDRFYPWKSKKDHPEALMSFIHDVGIPQVMVTDGAPELTDGKTREVCREYRIKQMVTVPYSPWQNLAEASVRELKKGVRRVMRRTGAPRRVWTYAARLTTAVRRLTALDIPYLEGRVAEENVKGSTPDISPYALFDWYQLVWYYTPTEAFPHQKKVIGRWLGVADHCTDAMAYHILPRSCDPIIRKDVWALTDDELATPSIKADIAELDGKIAGRLSGTAPEGNSDLPEPDFDVFEDTDEEPMEPFAVEHVQHEADDFTPEEMDEYLSALVMLPQGGELTRATVRRRVCDDGGLPIGKRNPNPILDSRLYEVEFPDGTTSAYTANMIVDN
jgi:hypothetical protein